ncbi:MAG: phosphate--acyl-ACP acyltransferase [Candidatus Cloacimonadota bacterium]|nr:MAG: phosphate--acyl-ACP acyltransferase [Candidatus Cloacimonadota bacterium]
MRIAIDAFGSDNAPLPEVEGAVLAIKENLCREITLVGKENILESKLAEYDYDRNRIKILHASEVIEMSDKAVSSVRKKKDSSLLKALHLYKNNEVDAVISAGNTGAVMTASLFTFGRIKNVLRPAIAVIVQGKEKPFVLLDVGANADCKPEHLQQFAGLGSLYAQYSLNRKNPSVGLLNIGEEETKGNELSLKTYRLLEEDKNLNFVGNIEGKYILDGKIDVVVCDGFVGNVMMKTMEGAVMTLFGLMKEEIMKSGLAKLGALLLKPVFKSLKIKLDHSEYGGALLAGVNGISVISHGSSNSKAIKNAVRFANDIAKSGFVQHVQEYYERDKI